MTTGRYFDNPAFREYVFLLVEIQRLIREGRNDDPEGEAIYDEMDSPGDNLNDDEINAVGEFASDLTRMSERYASILLPTEKTKRSSSEPSGSGFPPLCEQPSMPSSDHQTKS